MVDDQTPRHLGIRSFFYPFRGGQFLFRHPRLLSYVAIPFLINTLLYGFFFWFVGTHLGDWVNRFVPRGEAWYWAALFYVLVVVFAVLVLLVAVFTFTLVGNLILAPFNDLLSEKVEWVYSGNRLDEPFRLRTFMGDAWRSLKAEIGRLTLYLTGFLLLFALHLFPPVGTAVYAFAMPLYTLFFLGWEYLDYSMERWKLPFAGKRKVAIRNVGTLLGLGAGSAFLLLIPLVNLLAIPVCVTGATLLFCDIRSAGRVPRARPHGRDGGAVVPAAEKRKGDRST